MFEFSFLETKLFIGFLMEINNVGYNCGNVLVRVGFIGHVIIYYMSLKSSIAT